MKTDYSLPESSAKLSNICGLKYLKHFKDLCGYLKKSASAFEAQTATEYISDCNQLNFYIDFIEKQYQWTPAFRLTKTRQCLVIIFP